jgi:outer membrane protein assembly factor BamA
MQFNLIRIYQTFYRPLSGKLMIGLGYHLNDYFNIVSTNAGQGLPSPFLDYHHGQVVTRELSSGPSVDLVIDNRDSPIYGTNGYYAVMSFRTFPQWMGSFTSWQSFQTDFRGYTRVGPSGRGVFALWTTGWFTFGDVPYLELPAIGWDTYARSGRGYPQGRIKGKNQLYLEGEYRVTLSRDGLFGAAGFVNLTTTSDTLNAGFERIDAGGGLGLRIKLNKRSNTNITLDFAWGKQGSNGLFLGTGEAF